MVDKKFILPWINKADNDFLSAQYLAKNMHPAPIEVVCFHCQQAAEKYLKSFLVYNDQEPPKTHDLGELAKLCGGFSTDFLQLIQKCEYLTPFAANTRYPGVADPENDDMSKALAFVQDIVEFVKSKMAELFGAQQEEGAENNGYRKTQEHD
jgi:HEPN domain-containing protein